jgi:hypothetical protein
MKLKDLKKDFFYLVYFPNLGYYSDYQPNYEWSFTKDIKNAKLYRSLDFAEARIVSNSELNGELHICLLNNNELLIKEVIDFPLINERVKEKQWNKVKDPTPYNEKKEYLKKCNEEHNELINQRNIEVNDAFYQKFNIPLKYSLKFLFENINGIEDAYKEFRDEYLNIDKFI